MRVTVHGGIPGFYNQVDAAPRQEDGTDTKDVSPGTH